MKLNKLESIQMNNFLMKKELTSYLDGKNKNQVYKKKYTIFITNFIEDLFNIINQQILTFSQVYESISESQIQHLLNNNKNISYTMILNFYDKIISYFNNSKNKNISRNFSNNNINNKKTTNFTDRYNNNISEFEKNYFKRKYKTNINSPQNSSLHNNISNFNNSSNILSISSPNNSKNDSAYNIKQDYIDLNKLEKNKEKVEIQILVKSNKNKEFNNIKKVKNKIILNKQVYKVCNSIPISKKNFLSNAPVGKNSFNKKIKNNKINIKKSKNNLKSINISNSEDNTK